MGKEEIGRALEAKLPCLFCFGGLCCNPLDLWLCNHFPWSMIIKRVYSGANVPVFQWGMTGSVTLGKYMFLSGPQHTHL